MSIEPVFAINGRPYPVDDLYTEEKQLFFAGYREIPNLRCGPIQERLRGGSPPGKRMHFNYFLFCAFEIAPLAFVLDSFSSLAASNDGNAFTDEMMYYQFWIQPTSS
ncbi:MAG: hypothetical protein K2Y37_25580 [Pirellulales bacterium]|nr:hypothetical protein [Pirellulales bacterium]